MILTFSGRRTVVLWCTVVTHMMLGPMFFCADCVAVAENTRTLQEEQRGDDQADASDVEAQTAPEDSTPESEWATNPYLYENGPIRFEIERMPDYEKRSSDRKLDDSAKCAVKAAAYGLVTESYYDYGRVRAAAALGRIGHESCIEPLAIILRDEDEKVALRARCAIALGQIADQRVVEPLLDQFSDAAVGAVAHSALRRCLPKGPKTEWPKGKGDEVEKARQEIAEEWCTWWKENKETTVPDRENVLRWPHSPRFERPSRRRAAE